MIQKSVDWNKTLQKKNHIKRNNHHKRNNRVACVVRLKRNPEMRNPREAVSRFLDTNSAAVKGSSIEIIMATRDTYFHQTFYFTIFSKETEFMLREFLVEYRSLRWKTGS